MHLMSKENKMLFSLFRLVLKTEGGIQNVVYRWPYTENYCFSFAQTHWRLTHTLQLQTTQQHATHLEGSEQGPWGPCRNPRRREGSQWFLAEGAVAQCPWRTCGTAEGWACAGGEGSSAPSVSGGPPGALWPHPRNLGGTLGTCRSWKTTFIILSWNNIDNIINQSVNQGFILCLFTVRWH